MATVTNLLDQVFQTTFRPTMEAESKDMSRFFKDIEVSSDGVTNDGLSANWKYIQPIYHGLGGAAEFVPFDGPTASPTTASATAAIGYTAVAGVETFPGMSEHVQPEFYQTTCTLKRMLASTAVPTQLLWSAKVGNVKADLVEIWVRAAAKKIAHLKCSAFFLSSAGAIVTITTPGSSPNITSTGVSVTVKAGSPISRISWNGIACDIFAVSSNTRLNTAGPVILSRADGLGTAAAPVTNAGGSVLLSHKTAITTILSTSTDYELTFRNSGRENAGDITRLPARLDSILVDSGAITPYGLVVSGNPSTGQYGPFPEHKSMVRDMSGKVMSASEMASILAAYNQWQGGTNPITKMWTTLGVYSALFADLNGYFRAEINGARMNYQPGTTEKLPTMTFWGCDDFQFDWDRFISPGYAYGVNMKNNWSKKVPPRLPGAGSHPAFDPGVEFINSLWSAGGIWDGYRAVGGAQAGAATTQVEALMELKYEISCKQFAGIKLYNFTENYQ